MHSARSHGDQQLQRADRPPEWVELRSAWSARLLNGRFAFGSALACGSEVRSFEPDSYSQGWSPALLPGLAAQGWGRDDKALR